MPRVQRSLPRERLELQLLRNQLFLRESELRTTVALVEVFITAYR